MKTLSSGMLTGMLISVPSTDIWIKLTMSEVKKVVNLTKLAGKSVKIIKMTEKLVEFHKIGGKSC